MSAPTNRPPEIPGYQLLEKIGEGGKGEVFRARQENGDRTVAIKYLHPIPSPQLAADFQREADLMGSLTHPNVVAIYNCGKVEERFFLVMEYVPGSTLRSLMKTGEAWPPTKALRSSAKIADALTYMHSRDILPGFGAENVICGEARQDHRFRAGPVASMPGPSELGLVGIARLLLAERYGCRSISRDLFSLAAICYELLTGQLLTGVHPCHQRNPRAGP